MARAAEKIAGEIKAKGGKASAHAVDISDYDAVKRAVEAFEAASGPLSFLVNNAGWDRAANFLDTNPEFWRKIVAINLYGPLNVSHVVMKGMAARGFGRVVNIASDAGRVGAAAAGCYRHIWASVCFRAAAERFTGRLTAMGAEPSARS